MSSTNVNVKFSCISRKASINPIVRSYFDCSKQKSTLKEPNPTNILEFSRRNKRKILKIFLLEFFHQSFYEIFQSQLKSNLNDISTEYYLMDNKIIQFIIQDILETEEYTLEGIAFYTRIPFDVIYEAACGINNHFSMTSWARIIDLYIKVKPGIASFLIDKLLEIKAKNHLAFSNLLTEE